MNRFKLAGIFVLMSSLALSGCVARTYNLTRDREDQNLTSSSGNRGYLMGQAPQPQERASTRTVRVFEIELGKSKKADLRSPQATPSEITTITEDLAMFQEEGEEVLIQETSVDFQRYTVSKNDTLQKISKKFYGTTKNWMKIYNANKDVLTTPNKLYPGQVLKIPAGKNLASEELKETPENLK